MTKKNATQADSVRFPKAERYLFYGFTFELPTDCQFHHMQIVDNHYVAHTSQGEIILRHCLKCKRLRQLADFYEYNSACKTCHIFAVKKWKKNHPETAKIHAAKTGKKYRYLKKLVSAGLI